MKEKLIGIFKFDGDPTSVYDMIEKISETLENYGFSLKVDDKHHDGYEVVELKKLENTQPVKEIFSLSEKEEKDIQEWKEHIKSVFGEYGRFEYRFVPTGIGNGVYVKSSLAGIEKDFTDVDCW